MIVRWSLAELPGVLAELGRRAAVPRREPALVGLDVPARRPLDARCRRHGSRSRRRPTRCSPSAAARRSTPRSTPPRGPGLPLVSVPTTYSGAEWTTDLRHPLARPAHAWAAAAARTSPAIVYDVELTLGLPRGRDRRYGAERARALRRGALRRGPQRRRRRAARSRARALIGGWLPRRRRPSRTTARRAEGLLRGAAAGGEALALAGLGARARDGAGARRSLRPPARRDERALPAARRSASRAQRSPAAVARFGEALGGDAVAVGSSPRLGGFERLRDFGVPEDELPEVRCRGGRAAGNQSNPRPATPDEIEQLLRSICTDKSV